MSQHTERDMVWDQALQYATTEQSFDLTEIQDSIDRDVSKLIIRDTLPFDPRTVLRDTESMPPATFVRAG